MKLKELLDIINVKENSRFSIMFWIATEKNIDGRYNGVAWMSLFNHNNYVDMKDFVELTVVQVSASHEGTKPCIDIFLDQEESKKIVHTKNKGGQV